MGKFLLHTFFGRNECWEQSHCIFLEVRVTHLRGWLIDLKPPRLLVTLGSLLPGCRLDYDGGWWERPPPATRWRKFDSRTWHHMYVVVVLTPRVFLRGVFLRGFFSGFPGLILPLKATFHIPIRSRNSGQEEPLTEYSLLNSHLFLYILKKPFEFWWFKINSDEKTGKIRELIQRPSFCRHRQQPKEVWWK